MSNEKDELLAKKEELEQRLKKIQKDVASGLSADSEEQATELENYDVLVEIARVTQEELKLIVKKLNQLNE